MLDFVCCAARRRGPWQAFAALFEFVDVTLFLAS
jgi:hypothetical protein